MKIAPGDYIRDARGRIGLVINEQGTLFCQYTYGRGRYPRDSVTKIENGAQLFAEQQAYMWEQFEKLRPLVAVIARKYAPMRSMHYEQLLDAGLESLCYAIVTWDKNKSSLRMYASSVLVSRFMKVKARRSVNLETTEFLEDKSKKSVEAGLITSEELYNLGLSESEISILLGRYDSLLSFNDLRDELGVACRSTVRTYISKIIERCRTQSKSNPTRHSD